MKHVVFLHKTLFSALLSVVAVSRRDLFYRPLMCLLLFVLMAGTTWAQEICIYDATTPIDRKGKLINLVDTDNGVPMEHLGLDLPQLSGNVNVFVTFRRRGEAILRYVNNNENREETRRFYNFYTTNSNFRLHPHANGHYSYADALEIGERLREHFADEIRRWKAEDGLFDERQLMLIVVKEHMLEEGFPLAIVERYKAEGQKGACPLYYTNRIKLFNTEKRHVRQVNFEESAIQVGNELQFPELLKISGPSNKRLVVDRVIEMCTFAEDYDRLITRQGSNSRGIRRLRELISHQELGAGGVYPISPFVYPGERFEKMLTRRMAGDVMRDTLMHFRRRLAGSPWLTEEVRNDSNIVRWRMPDVNRYYRLRHTYYMHDFQQVDTTSEACVCARTNPLRFLALSTEPALPDCPPLINGRFPEDYRPLVKRGQDYPTEQEVLDYYFALIDEQESIERMRFYVDSTLKAIDWAVNEALSLDDMGDEEALCDELMTDLRLKDSLWMDSIMHFEPRTKGFKRWGAYYYYVLLHTQALSRSEVIAIGDQMRAMGRRDTGYCEVNDVPRATDMDWIDLLRPIAANLKAVEAIRLQQWDPTILEPYISWNLPGNVSVVSEADMIDDEVSKTYKYINPDFVIYNQIQMMLGVGTTESLQKADSLIQLLEQTRYSEAFRAKYQPERLDDVLGCFEHQPFKNDLEFAARIARTNIINYYVMNMAIGHEAYMESGQYGDPLARAAFTACYDSLPALMQLPEGNPAKNYFHAVTLARWAEMTLSEEKDQLLIEARNQLTELFRHDPEMIATCQGDRYVRDVYRTPELRRQQMDIYMEAVEEYIRWWSRRDISANE